MTIRAVAKSKPKPRMVRCPDCDGRLESVAVMGRTRDGEPMPGIELRNEECSTCSSTGKVRAKRAAGCVCCNGPASDRCANCARAGRGGNEIHVCLIPHEDDLAFAAELSMAPTPLTGEHAAYTSKAALAESYSKMRSPDRE